MSDNTNLLVALENLQDAQLAMEAALKKIEEHNIDLEAHADIRSDLQQIKNDGGIYTNAQIDAIIEEGLKEHIEAEDLAEAHPAFAKYDETIQAKLAELESRLSSLEALVKGTSDDGTVTDLNRAIKAIESEYAAKLENLNTSYQLAVANNDTELATQINNRITELLKEKNDRILAVIEQYGNGGSSSGDVVTPVEPETPVEDEKPTEEEKPEDTPTES